MNKPLAKGLLSAIAERVLGEPYSRDEPRADMYLPLWIFGLGLFLLVCCIAAVVCAVVIPSLAAAIAALVCFILAAAAMLCWKNQSARMLSDDEFEYKTFLGNTRRYSFSQITRLKQNPDSCTLFVGKEKIHIETCAILTDRFIERINRQLSENG